MSFRGARDLPARQQTLRAAIAWSYDLLPLAEQTLFRRLAVFVDGWTWEAAETICQAAGPLTYDILDGLASLVDQSLVRQEEQAEGEARFSMLQVLREFGLERLTETGELEATRTAHATYYLALAEEAEPLLRGNQQAHWFNRLEQEYENQRAALFWLLEQARNRGETEEGKRAAEQVLRLSAALAQYWYVRGYFREGLTENAVRMPPCFNRGMKDCPPHLLLRARCTCGMPGGRKDVLHPPRRRPAWPGQPGRLMTDPNARPRSSARCRSG